MDLNINLERVQENNCNIINLSLVVNLASKQTKISIVLEFICMMHEMLRIQSFLRNYTECFQMFLIENANFIAAYAEWDINPIYQMDPNSKKKCLTLPDTS